jgi:hypothetical protein
MSIWFGLKTGCDRCRPQKWLAPRGREREHTCKII